MDDRHAWIGHVARRVGGAYVSRRLIPKDNVRVAMTHYVLKEDLENFSLLVESLRARRALVTPARFFRHFSSSDGEPICGRTLLLTFDDGLLSAYEAAQQVLNPAGIKAIFFIPTKILELQTRDEMREFACARLHYGMRTPESFRPEEYVTMGPEHIHTLHEQGHMILPHTHSHVQLRDITTPSLIERELVRPRSIIEDLLQSSANGFAAPSGTPRTISPYAYCQISNIYALCFTALAGANTPATDPLFIRRDSIHPWYSIEHVSNIVDGIFDPYFSMKARALRRRAGWRYLSISREARSSQEVTRAPGPADQRAKFVARVAEVFEHADVEYVFLHGYRPVRAVDSDVDVAVDRKSLNVVDGVIRTGVLGRLVQCLHYAVPWCRYYVLEVDEPGRRYRQLDVVCDPWGIGRDGTAVRVALSRSVLVHGMRVPDPAAEALYLAVKRARKRMYGRRDQESLARAFRRDRATATRLLACHFGSPGASLAAALERGEPDLVAELEAIRRCLTMKRWTPVQLARRLVFSAARVVRRTLRPTGLVVCIVGPDGVGKSTLANALQRHSSGVFRRTMRLHSSPGFVPSPARLLGRPAPNRTDPHGVAPSGIIGSIARVAYVWLDTLLGWWLLIAPARAHTSLVLLERGVLDLSVDPLRYRVSLPARVIRGVGAALPRPDLTLLLSSPIDVIRARKPELDVFEIERQLEAWRLLAARDPSHFVAIDSSGSPDATLDQAMRTIGDRLASRQRDLRSCSLALRCLGGLRRGGERYSLISTRGEPRWLVPARVGAPGPRSAGLYRPARARHAAGALMLEALQRAGIGRLKSQLTLDAANGLSVAIARTLGHRSCEVAAAATGDWRRGERALLSVRVDGRPAAFVKVAREEGAKLDHERRVLEVLGSCRLETLLVPELIDSFTLEDCNVIVLRPLETQARADRSIGPSELAGLAELATLTKPLAEAIGTSPGLIPVHGDFAPWNSSPRGANGLALWDWEWTHLGLPLEDLFYWRLQRLVRFGDGSVDSLVLGAFTPDAEIRALSDRLGISPEVVAPRALRACLERAVSPLGEMRHLPRVPSEALALLNSRGL